MIVSEIKKKYIYHKYKKKIYIKKNNFFFVSCTTPLEYICIKIYMVCYGLYKKYSYRPYMVL